MPIPLDPLYGIPEAAGTSEDFPITWRDDYLGIARGPDPLKDDWKCCRVCGKVKHTTIGIYDALGWICNLCLEDIS